MGKILDAIKHFFRWLRFLWVVSRLGSAPIAKVAKQAVREVNVRWELQHIAQSEPMTSFCPRCGQLPTGDRRMEEAREHAIENLRAMGVTPKTRDLNFALEYYHYIL